MSQYPAPYDSYEPKPPARSTGKTVAGIAFGALAAFILLGFLVNVISGNAHAGTGAHLFGWFLGLLIGVGIPGFASYRLLTSHQRDVQAFRDELAEQDRQRRLTGGGF